MNEIRNTKYERRGFTLIELVVAIGVMAMVIAFAGVVFKASIASYRIATAQAEIMQKFRAITDQLSSDFRGLHVGMPVFLWFEVDDSNDRFDQIMLFADGDFQSVRPYDTDMNPPHYQIPRTTGSPVVGNVARIQYGQAKVYSPVANKYWDPNEQVGENSPDRFFNKKYRTLSRRQHILTADPNIIPWPDPGNFINSFEPNRNDDYEHDTNSLSQWQALLNVQANQDHVMDICFHYRPRIDYQNSTGLHMLMAEGVPNFMIQLTVDDPINGTFSWQPENDAIKNNTLPPVFFWPRAVKFTFTLYDSQGVFKNGQTFTHIVYIGD